MNTVKVKNTATNLVNERKEIRKLFMERCGTKVNCYYYTANNVVDGTKTRRLMFTSRGDSSLKSTWEAVLWKLSNKKITGWSLFENDEFEYGDGTNVGIECNVESEAFKNNV